MLTKLQSFYVLIATVAAKVPHWVLASALAVTIWGPWVLALYWYD